MLYTIAEISNLIGLSKVSIYRKLKLKQLEPCISKKQGVTYVTEEGLTLIKDTLKVTTDEIKGGNNDSDSISPNDYIATDTEDFNFKEDYINTLKDQLKVKDLQLNEKDVQLKHKDIQLNQKDIQIGELHSLIENSQVLLKEKPKQDILQLEDHFKDLDNKLIEMKDKMQKKDQDHIGLFKRIFKK
ncbi:hypothetical protein LGK95_21055 [Clostridium algoriphilum]|uniref:hypothetical protein n=1 Tax=Clostridium algoriphilum TaxID=198347 RepID=UPI001CF33DCA|nr:hypothetical protein [Clostridium algoriphilum]MCB2295952.1 hypothetical protein [Clostridium algoriphilum]